MSDDASISAFSSRPYKVTYKDLAGETKTYTRTPPAKLHDMLPTDEVILSRKKSDDFREGDTATIKGINPRHPNVLQLEHGGNTTFVDYYDVSLNYEVAQRDGVDPRDQPQRNRYLLWP